MLLLVMIALILAVYWPAATFGFLKWDDQLNLTHNPLFNPPLLHNIPYYWHHFFLGLYIPVTYSIWTLVGLLAHAPTAPGQTPLNPYVFHSLNIFVHILGAVFAWLLLYRLTGHRLASWFGAALFALHPVNVEAVAWITGFRDCLSGALALACLWAYVHGENPKHEIRNPKQIPVRPPQISTLKSQIQIPKSKFPNKPTFLWYLLATVLFALAILAKPAAAAVIPMAVLIDILCRRRQWWKSTIWLLPWILGTGAIIWVTRQAQPPPASADVAPWYFRLLIAGDALWFYLNKLFVPVGLCVHYGRTPHFVLSTGLAWKTTIGTVAVGLTIYLLGRRRHWIWLASLLFVAGLLPVLGFIPFDFQSLSTTADRYMYLAMIGPALAATMLLARHWNKTTRIAAIIVLLILGTLSFRQVLTWRNTDTVFTHALAINPRSNLAMVKLAELAITDGHHQTADQLLHRAWAAPPENSRAWINLGQAFERLHDPANARQCYLHVINTDHTRTAAGAYSNLAAMDADAGDLNHAIELYRQALQLNPNLPQAIAGLQRAQHSAP